MDSAQLFIVIQELFSDLHEGRIHAMESVPVIYGIHSDTRKEGASVDAPFYTGVADFI